MPYFWSDQHGRRLQGYGFPLSSDDIALLYGSPNAGHFVLGHGRNRCLVAVTGVGMPKQVRQARMWITEARPWGDVVRDSLSPV